MCDKVMDDDGRTRRHDISERHCRSKREDPARRFARAVAAAAQVTATSVVTEAVRGVRQKKRRLRLPSYFRATKNNLGNRNRTFPSARLG